VDITVNGTSYSSWDDVPDDLKQQLAGALPDADGNGVPDLFEGDAGLADLLKRGSHVTTSTSIQVGDQTYASMAELPEGMQELMKRALSLTEHVGAATPEMREATAAAAAPPPAVPPAVPGPNQVVLNGETVDLSAPAPRKGFFRRLFR
jgi:hypothetical protein